MGTKPVTANDLPPVWGAAGPYPATNYPALLPWLEVNPVGGLPTPWSNQPRLNTTALTSFANNGMTPQSPNDASSFNEWLRRVQEYARWVDEGTSAPDADTHIVETDVFGQVQAVAFTATAGFQGASSNPAIMIKGIDVPASETVTFEDASTLVLVGSSDIAGDAGSVIKGGTFEITTGTGAPGGARQFTADAADNIVYNRAGTLMLAHVSPNGYVYATGDQEAETGLAVIHQVATTTATVTALALGQVRVIVEGQVQMALGGIGNSIVISVQDDQGGWADIGTAQTIIASKDTSTVNDWQLFRHERVFTAGTATATLYRCQVDPQGTTGKVKEVRLRVVNKLA